MRETSKANLYTTMINVIIWGTIWGIFEATVGYLLHLVSFGYSWVIMYPFACFFMMNVYCKTNRVSSILYVGMLCAAIKMLNLFLPGRIDKVINPAISIAFEALAMAGIIHVVNFLFKEKNKNPFIKAFTALAMNTGWRLLFVLYLLFLVPDWIRDVSVISSAEKFIPFFVTQNLITSTLVFIGYQFKNVILSPVEMIENSISNGISTIPKRTTKILQVGLAALMLCANIALQFVLK